MSPLKQRLFYARRPLTEMKYDPSPFWNPISDKYPCIALGHGIRGTTVIDIELLVTSNLRYIFLKLPDLSDFCRCNALYGVRQTGNFLDNLRAPWHLRCPKAVYIKPRITHPGHS